MSKIPFWEVTDAIIVELEDLQRRAVTLVGCYSHSESVFIRFSFYSIRIWHLVNLFSILQVLI